MTTPTIADYLKYANLQMAAEAFIRDEVTNALASSGADLITALTAGNKRSLKFTQPQAEAFTAQWEVVDQKANTNTGFSGTLFKAIKDDAALGIKKDDLVVSFRSTEFIDDHARDNKATNDLEIDGSGFALGQIADMEAWYAKLTASSGALAGKTYSVTGYSLGGHLATVFNQLRHAELQAGPPVATLDQVITFNGAGVGEVRNGTLTALVDRFIELRGMASSADGLSSLFQTLKGRQAYQSLRDAIRNNGGIPIGAMKDTVANVFGSLNEGDTLLQADRDLLLGANGALTRALKVVSVATDIPKLKPGVDGTDQPTRVADAKIDAESVDYQLAVLTAQAEFNTRSRLTAGDVLSVLISGGIAKEYGEPRLGNQIDAVGWEFSADTPVALVANSLWHYGTDARLFIEDQPNVRNGVVAAVTNASVAAGDFRPLVEGFATRDFGDDHSLVLIIDSLNVQNTLLNLIPAGQRTAASPTLASILKNASWRKGVDGSNGGDNAQGQAEGDVLENVVNALADLFLGPQVKAQRLTGNPNGNTWWELGKDAQGNYVGSDGTTYSGREALYATLDRITKTPAYASLAGKLTLTDSNGITAEQGRTDFASFAALYSLSPFQLYTNDGLLQNTVSAAWGTAYADWNTDKANAANPGAALTYSVNWLADRADFLTRKNWFNANNKNPEKQLQNESPFDLSGNTRLYWDAASGYRVAAGFDANSPDDNTRRISFGDETGNVLAGGGVGDRLYGMSGNDYLDGKWGDDSLDAGRDNDILVGGQGSDTIDGGIGFDTYVWNTGDGADRIIDADKRGRLLVNGSAAKLLVQKTATTWISHDGKLTLTQPEDSSGGWKLDIAGGGSLDLGSSFNDGDYGLYRQDAAPVLPTNPTIVGDRSPKEFTANFTGTIDYNKFGPGWYITQITVTAEHADPEDATKSIVDAYKVTYNTKDALGNYVTEGDGSAPNRNDTLNGDATQADYIQAFGGNDEIDAKGGNDRIQAGAGDDLVDAGAGHDLVEGGSGADRLLGGDGRDTLWGDSAASGSTPIASAIAGGETDSSQNSKGDWLDGGTGDDILIGGTANDVLVAGAENDLLVGGAGDDLLLGDGIGQINPAASWSTGRQVSTDPDTKITSYTATFSGSSATWFSQFGGADMLYGGAGDDWVFAGTGDDQVDGGKGQDVLFGEAGNDVVLGGAGDDVINGDSAGLAESLQGHDWLDGGEGDDTLEGMGGDDVLIGGKGDDSLVGGAGRDTYIYNQGDGVDAIWDDDTGAEKSILVFGEGVSKDAIKLRKGSLLLDLGNGDGVHIENFNADDPLGMQSVASFNFADGTSLGWGELLARGFDLDGTEGDDTILGTGIEDRIDGKGGNDVLKTWGRQHWASRATVAIQEKSRSII